jgi:hypothetical protein
MAFGGDYDDNFEDMSVSTIPTLPAQLAKGPSAYLIIDGRAASACSAYGLRTSVLDFQSQFCNIMN